MFASRPLVEELPSSTSLSAPGWAYVPDVGLDPVKAGHRPAHRKRTAARAPAGSAAASNRLEAARVRKLADLDRDNARDVAVPVPSRPKDGRARGKTANSRKILQAQKTFANYLADDEAWAALAEHSAPQPNQHTKPAAAAASQKRASAAKADAPAPLPPRRSSPPPAPHSSPPPPALAGQPHGPPPAATNPFWNPAPPPPAPLTAAEERLLRVPAPALPAHAQMRALTLAPPLTFAQARADLVAPRRPARWFCEMCGFEAPQRCAACGGRTCGGRACVTAHATERCIRYGA